MGEELVLEIGGVSVALHKSDKVVGLRPRPEAASAFEAATTSDVAAGRLRRKDRLGGFEIVELPDDDAGAWLDRRRADTDVDVGTHVFYTSDDEVPFVPTGEIYVVFSPDADLETQSRILSEHGLTVLESRGDSSFVVATTARSRNPVNAAGDLAANPAVRVAEPELATPKGRNNEPVAGDALMAEQWHLRNTGFHSGTRVGFRAGADARVLKAWQVLPMRGNPDITVAVIDDGFDLTHPDFGGRTADRFCFTRASTDVSPDWGDWHGTACAGVALAAAGGGQALGVAPECRLVAIRWGIDLSDREIEAWFGFAQRSGAAVVSNSWGAAARYFPLSTRAREAISRCAREGRGGKGCVVVFAAGNADTDIDDRASGSLNGFAVHPDVIAVAATTSMDERAHYSNFGRRIWVSAPSSGAGGWGIVTTDVTGTGMRPDGQIGFRGYDRTAYTAGARTRFGGTSSACPLVAGVCALVLSVNPTLTATQVRQILANTARPLPGQVRPHDPLFGFGCVDAHAAVVAASRLPGARPLLPTDDRENDATAGGAGKAA